VDELDENGVLRPGALAPLGRDDGYTVFAQRKDATFDIDVWQRQADKFFAAKIGLMVPKRYTRAPEIDAARVIVTRGAHAIRLVMARPRDDDDLAAAERAEIACGTSGLALLARRCAYVFLVEREGDRDPPALLLAAILASVLLGPIVTRDEIFGVRTARQKLSEAGAG
jgi:hypothetical protein